MTLSLQPETKTIAKMRRLLAILFVTLSFVFTSIINMDAKTRYVESNWSEEFLRSVTLFLSIEGNDLRIHSEKQFDNVGIQVVAPNGQTIYVNVINISAEAEMAIPLSYLPEGNYQVILTKNNQPVIWYLTK